MFHLQNVWKWDTLKEGCLSTLTCGGGGQFKEVSAGARVRRREDLMGFPLLVGVFVHGGPRNSSVVLPPEGGGGGGGQGWEAVNGEQTLTAAGGGEVEY